MSDPFAAFGEEIAPARPRASQRVEKPKSALDQKMEERQRLSARYRALKKQERERVFREEPRLLDFMRYLRKVGPEDGDALIEAVADSWLPAAPLDVRHFALHLVGRRSDRIRTQLGLEPLDDPLPEALGGDGPSVFSRARDILRAGGNL